jgi:hypothetical protein
VHVDGGVAFSLGGDRASRAWRAACVRCDVTTDSSSARDTFKALFYCEALLYLFRSQHSYLILHIRHVNCKDRTRLTCQWHSRSLLPHLRGRHRHLVPPAIPAT